MLDLRLLTFMTFALTACGSSKQSESPNPATIPECTRYLTRLEACFSSLGALDVGRVNVDQRRTALKAAPDDVVQNELLRVQCNDGIRQLEEVCR